MILIFFIKLADDSNNCTGGFHSALGVRTVDSVFHSVFISIFFLSNINPKSKSWVSSVTYNNQLILCFPLIWYKYGFKIAASNRQQSPSQHQIIGLKWKT